MNHKLTIIAVAATLVAATTWAAGPRGMGGSKGAWDPQLAKILGRNTAFSATVVTTIARTGADEMTMQSEMAMLDGKVRYEMDMSKMKMGKGQSEDMSSVKGMGMERQVVIARPDKHVTYMVYPGMKAYVEMAMPEKKTDSDAKDVKTPKIERVELGKETVDGHPCIKTKRTVTDENGDKFEALVWEATDLDHFPIQTQHQDPNGTLTTLFKNISHAKPAASLFEAPEGYKKYENMMQMMMGAAMQRMPGAGGNAGGGE